MSRSKGYILTLGLQPAYLKMLRQCELGVEIKVEHLDLQNFVEDHSTQNPLFVICGVDNDLPRSVSKLNELAQSIRSSYKKCKIYLVLGGRQGFNRQTLLKNGFSDVFLMPNDTRVMCDVLRLSVSDATKGRVKFFKPVNLVDIVPGERLGFDLYLHLPVNGKHIRFASKDSTLEEARAERLRHKQVSSMFVSLDQMQSFYEFTAHQLRQLRRSSAGETLEQRHRRERAIRELLAGIFNDDSDDSGDSDSLEKGRVLLDNCREIIKAYIQQTSNSAEWFQEVMSHAHFRSEGYARTADIATFASLFSIGLNIGDPQSLALSGLLEDIGLIDLPEGLAEKDPSQYSGNDQQLYSTHPQLSLNILKARKIALSDDVIKAISQHHERFDGHGFPRGLEGRRVSAEAQVLAFAEWFTDHIAREADPQPYDAIRDLYQRAMSDPANAAFDPEFLKQTLNLFPKPTNEAQLKEVI